MRGCVPSWPGGLDLLLGLSLGAWLECSPTKGKYTARIPAKGTADIAALMPHKN